LLAFCGCLWERHGGGSFTRRVDFVNGKIADLRTPSPERVKHEQIGWAL
jgi:hypothetical protein